MKRLKWLRAESRSSIREIAKQLQREAFREGVDTGFLLDRARDNALEARYVERIEFTETFMDPFGNSQTATRVVYKEVDFTLTKKFPGLELRMPPRGLAAFVNRLMKASNFSMTIENCNVDVLRWTRAIEKAIGAKAGIKGAIATDIELGEGAVAKVGIVAPKDVRPALAEILGGRKHKLSNLQLEYNADGLTQRLMLSADCAVRYSEHLADSDLDAVRETLGDLIV